MVRLFFYVLMSVHLASCVYIRVKLEAAAVGNLINERMGQMSDFAI